MRTTPLIAAVIAVALALAACGSDDEATAPAETTATATAPTTSPVASATDDKRLAKRAVLTLSDFPGGWTKADDPDTSGTSTCAGLEAARRTRSARAVGGQFSKDLSHVNNYVYLYQDEPRATAAFESLTTPSQRRCEGKEYGEGIEDGAEFRLTDVSTSSLNIDPIGSDSAAGRIVLSYKSRETDIDDERVIDVVVIREGRALALVDLIEDSGGAFDEELRARLSSIAARRLRDLLNP